MHIKERVPQVLAAVAGTGRAIRRHRRRTVATGAALLLVAPLLTGSGVDGFAVNALGLAVGALMLRRFMGARNRKQAIQALRQSKVERRTR